MLDLKAIRKNPESFRRALALRDLDFDVSRFTTLDELRSETSVTEQDLLARRNQAGKKVGQLIKEGVAVEEAKARVAEEVKIIDSELGQAAKDAQKALQDMQDFLMATPNIPAEDVPPGRDEQSNVELERWSEPTTFSFTPKDHVELGEALNTLDFPVAVKLATSRFAVLKGDMAALHRALAQFMLGMHTAQHGYTEVNVPFITNADSLRGTGQLPKFEEDLFRLDNGMYLIPTAEVPVTNLLRDTIIDKAEAEKGVRLVAHTPCFRSEAGSHGRDVRGLIRQHQFEKVELVQFSTPANAPKAFEELTSHAEAVLQALGLSYRKVLLCGGDLGFSAHKTIDLEVWIPSQGCYREISSCSWFGDYQARRMGARYRGDTGKPELLHTINGSGLAVGRTLVAVLENYQEEDGRIRVPEVLIPLVGKTHLG
jgi:seryl-tRNA synthetase